MVREIAHKQTNYSELARAPDCPARPPVRAFRDDVTKLNILANLPKIWTNLGNRIKSEGVGRAYDANTKTKRRF